ncbi:MAG: alpha/beta-hydrolase family protein, partial [Actinomycetales bacterium]|nr:alpha/beta-hydrolase family protein [Actinomycetales bacterium]
AGRRLPMPVGTAGGVAEVVAVSATAGAAISAADLMGLALPEPLRPRHPVAVAGGVVVAGAAVAVVSTHPRFLGYFALPPVPGAPPQELSFQPGSTLPGAIGRAVGVAGLAVAVMWAESHAADRLAVVLDRSDRPGVGLRVLAHGLLVAGFAASCAAGLGLYLTRFTVQNRLLEAAYAAVPNRFGVTGGPGSAYAFATLGREGRRFVSQAHTAEELTAVLGVPATDPVRVFVPLGQLSGDPRRDAAAVVDEMERVGAFAKGTIVLAVPTGDGYVSYVQTETVEMLTAGDCATVIVPYAQIPSTWAFFAAGRRAAAHYALFARAISDRLRDTGAPSRLFLFGESLGSIVALDAFGPDLVATLDGLGFSGGLYLGVPRYSHVDRVLRPRDPRVRRVRGLQYAADRDQVRAASPGHLNVTHPSDPLGVADVSLLVRHPVDYWGRPTGAFVPVVSFLIELSDVKNAMTLRPGDFSPSPGHDYRYETALAVARAYGLPFDREEVIELALRERELAWSVRRLLARRIGDAREAVVAQLQSWGVDPANLGERFAAQRAELPAWLDALLPDGEARTGTAADRPSPGEERTD